jgi:AcrR family transcriptional regulator
MAKSPYHHGNLRDALVAAAIEILEADGLSALTLRAVARRVGVSQTAPYRHFNDKEALLAAVAAEGFRRKHQIQMNYVNAAPDVGKFRASGKGYVAFGSENPELLKLMFGAAIRDWSQFPELVAASRVNYDGLLAAAAAALPEDSPVTAETVASAAWSMVHGLTLLLVDGQITPERAGAADQESLVDQVLDMLGGPPPKT